jgi:hypothetical protein
MWWFGSAFALHFQPADTKSSAAGGLPQTPIEAARAMQGNDD